MTCCTITRGAGPAGACVGRRAASGSMRSAITNASFSSSIRQAAPVPSRSRSPSTVPAPSVTVMRAWNPPGSDVDVAGAGSTRPSMNTSAWLGDTKTTRPSRCSTAAARSRGPMHVFSPRKARPDEGRRSRGFGAVGERCAEGEERGYGEGAETGAHGASMVQRKAKREVRWSRRMHQKPRRDVPFTE